MCFSTFFVFAMRVGDRSNKGFRQVRHYDTCEKNICVFTRGTEGKDEANAYPTDVPYSSTW